MQYFFLGLLAALAATPHCLGMCGGFALHLSRAPEWRGRLLGYGLFFAGKTTVYVFLGALVGALGMALLGAHRSPAAASALAYAAGGLTVLLGVAMLIPWKPGRSSGSAEAAVASLGARVMASTGGASSLALGLFAGFLPCPLTTSLLLLAAGYHSVTSGVALLLGAAVGTAPGLLAAGLAGGALSLRWQKVGLRALAVVVILLGLLMIVRHATAGGPACCVGGA